MENYQKEVKELSNQRIEHSLSLRKKKLNEYIFKRRLEPRNKTYSIKKEDIHIRPEFKDKKFKDIKELLNFCTNILGNEQSDINDIKFVIFMLKMTEIKKDEGEISDSNILKEMTKVFVKYINDIIIVDGLLGILINFTYFLETETNMNLLTNDYLTIYSKITTLYFNDDSIFCDLITLLGNLSCDNNTAQKLFYTTNLFEEIYNLVLNEKAPKVKRDICIWFLAIFTKGIQKNNYFINNIKLFKSLIDIMVLHFPKEEHTECCLDSIGNLCEIPSLVEYIIKKAEIFNYILEVDKQDLFYLFNKILANITSYNEDVNLYLIENYKLIPYILKNLSSSSTIIKGQMIFIIGNIVENKPSKINEILYNFGIIDKIFEFLDTSFPDNLDKALFVLNIILMSLNKEGIFRLFQKNIHLKLINILKNDYKRDIIDKTIDAIFKFLEKDSQDCIIKQSFIDNGLKEVFSTMVLDRNDAEIFLKTEEILKNYF